MLKKKSNHEEPREHEEKRRFIIHSLRESSCPSWWRKKNQTSSVSSPPFAPSIRDQRLRMCLFVSLRALRGSIFQISPMKQPIESNIQIYLNNSIGAYRPYRW